MKKIICALICLMMLATFVTAACADQVKYSYTLQARTVSVRAPGRSGYRAMISGVLKVTFRRADHLSNGGTKYTKSASTSSSYGAVGKPSPWITLSVSANNPADDLVSGTVSGTFYYAQY